MKKYLQAKLMLIALLFITTISNAQSPTAPALAFNVFVQNGATFYSSETEGPVGMGGDLTIAGNYNCAAHNNFSYKVNDLYIGLLVGGKVNYNGGNSFQVLNNGYVQIGNQNGSKAWYLDNNNAGSPIRITPSSDYNGSPNILLSAHASDLGNVSASNNPVFQTSGINFGAAFTTMKATSTSIAGLSANADLTNPNGDFHSSSISTILNHTPGGQIKINLNSGNNILNVTGDELNSVNNFTFNNAPDASHILYINVNASGTFNWSAWTNGGFGGQTNCAYIFYNFYNTTTLNIGGNGAIEGTIFAPYADISKSSNNSNIEGQVICKSYSQSAGGEIHFATFAPNAPVCILPTVADITGIATVCKNATTTLANATANGVWSTSNSAIATVSGGVVTGVAAGTATITYSVTNSCGTTSKTKTVTVNDAPTVADITGTATVCKSSSTTLADVTASGVWSTSNSAIATVSGGIVTGVAAGSATISYSVTNTCGTTTKTRIVTVNATTTSTTNARICAGSSYIFNGTTYSTAGTYVAHLTNAVGCDSAATLVLTVNELPSTPATTVTQPTCSVATGTIAISTPIGIGMTYSIDGINYQSSTFNTVAAGTYSVTAKNANGCFSSVASVTVNAQPVSPVVGDVTGTATICRGSSTTLTDATASGVWSTSNAAIATISGGVVTGVAAGTATISYSVTNTCGTTSKVKIVTVNAPSTSTTNAAICAGSSYIFNGTTYSIAGTYVVHLTNAVGCDSAATLILTVNNLTASSTSRTICSSELPYNWNSHSYNAAGTYVIHLTNAVGCDSAATLILTVNNPTASSTSRTICSTDLPYSWNSHSYNAAGTYVVHLTNAVGCDSAATLILSVNNPTASSTSRTICSSELPYSWNSHSYNAAGTYVVHLTNAVGCDSAATLILTVNNPTASSTSRTICSSELPYNWNSHSYNAAGTYVIHLTNAVGCDSAATLILTVNDKPAVPTVSVTQPTCLVSTGSITVTAPIGAGITYSIDGINYQSATSFSSLSLGSYSVTAKNASGCISTVATAVITKAVKPSDWAYTSNYLTTTQPLSSNSFTFVVYSNSVGDTYNWNFGDGTNSTLASPTKSFSHYGIYNVELIATNVGGCSDTSFQTVVVTPPSKAMDAIPVCGSGTASTITQKVIFPTNTTDWASTNLKMKTAAKFDTTLGTLLGVKIINNGSFTTNNKVEITGNMAAGTKRLVNIQVSGTMDVTAPGFMITSVPPTIVDSFSSTGFDGIKDFAGTSGKDFGPHTSALTDSTVFTSADILSAYKGVDSVYFFAYTNTNSSASFPTGNDTAIISTKATDTVTVVYYYCPAANMVSGGGGGGLESKSLGDAIVKRVFNKAFNSLQIPVDYNTMPSPETRSSRVVTMGAGANGQLTLADILPQQLSKYNFKSYLSTPTDITSITNASDVLSIDYTLNNLAKAVSFGTQTSGKVYDHTKAICDRLKGSVLMDIQNVSINNVNMVTYVLKTAEGNTEYAMSFAIGAKSGRNNYTIQSNWLNQDYIADETMYNIQLWAVAPDIINEMAANIIATLQSAMPVQVISGKKLPNTYITSGSRDKTNLILSVTNNQTNSNGYFVIEDKSNEQSAALNTRTVPFTVQANGKATVNIPMSDIYESTVSMYINNQLQDVVYMADGTWSYGAGANSNISSFAVSNDTNKTYLADELPVFRNVKIAGTSADYVSIFKLLKGGAAAQDISAYKTLRFTASGGYNLRITLVKNSIVNWSDQYATLIPLSNDAKEYNVSLDAFVSALTKDKINANDVTTIVFSIEVGNTQSNAINSTLSNISFAKQDAAYLQSLTAREVQLYPNPSVTSKFTCSFMSDKQAILNLRVIEMITGRVVATKQVNAVTGINNVTVDLNRTNSGSSVYIIALDGDNVQYKKAKIIVGGK